MTNRTDLAVGELIQAAAHQHGVVGPVPFTICRPKPYNWCGLKDDPVRTASSPPAGGGVATGRGGGSSGRPVSQTECATYNDERDFDDFDDGDCGDCGHCDDCIDNMISECGLQPDGSCNLVGTEHCDWYCGMRDLEEDDDE